MRNDANGSLHLPVLWLMSRAHTFGTADTPAAFFRDVQMATETDILLSHHGGECVNG